MIQNISLNSGSWKVFTGNEVGGLLGWWLWYAYKQKHPNIDGMFKQLFSFFWHYLCMNQRMFEKTDEKFFYIIFLHLVHCIYSQLQHFETLWPFWNTSNQPWKYYKTLIFVHFQYTIGYVGWTNLYFYRAVMSPLLQLLQLMLFSLLLLYQMWGSKFFSPMYKRS